MTELCELALRWGSDKAIFYTPYYHEILNSRRQEVKRVLEFGIGYPETMMSTLARIGVKDYTTGASLFMWREYFSNAEIFALDNNRDIFINESRIHSFYCDQAIESTFAEAIANVGSDFDLIVEDGSHIREHQLRTARLLMPLLKPDGIYIMEDVGPPFKELQNEISYLSELKQFSRDDLSLGEEKSKSSTAAVVRIYSA